MFFARRRESLAGVKRQLHVKAIQEGSLGIWPVSCPCLCGRLKRFIFFFLFSVGLGSFWAARASELQQGFHHNAFHLRRQPCFRRDDGPKQSDMSCNALRRAYHAEKAGSWEGFKEALQDKGKISEWAFAGVKEAYDKGASEDVGRLSIAHDILG